MPSMNQAHPVFDFSSSCLPFNCSSNLAMAQTKISSSFSSTPPHALVVRCTEYLRLSLPGAFNPRSFLFFHFLPKSYRRNLLKNSRLCFRTCGKIQAIDAAQPFDYEARKQRELENASKLKVGIVGFGNFGQFLAQRFVEQGHSVLAHSRSDYGGLAREMGVSYFRDPDDFCEEHPEVILLCTSILSTESVLRTLPLQRLRRNTLFVDVLSVKEFPRNLFLQLLPPEFDILCTHPMFGPQSGKGSWAGLPFVYDKVRIGGGARSERCEKFLKVFNREGCRMVEMSCAEHDRHAAGSQFITHTVGRVLGKLDLEATPISTKGYEQLLQLVENTNSDSFDLYYGLFMYNINATEQLERLELAFDSVKKQLFGQLHDILRKQLFDGVEMKTTEETPKVKVQRLLQSSSSSQELRAASNGYPSGAASDGYPSSTVSDEQ